MSTIEYGIAHRNDVLEEQVHRTGMTKEEAEQWIAEWEQDGGVKGAFYVIEREISPWKSSK